MSNVFVGVVEGFEPGTVAVGLLDEEDGRVTASLFSVEKTHVNEYYVPEPDGRRSFRPTADLAGLGQFLQDRIHDRSKVRFLVEVPETIPHPPDTVDGIPHPVLPTDAVVLKVLVFLGVQDYVAAPFQIDAAATTAVLFPIRRSGELAHLRPIAPKYLPHGICHAYGQLLSLRCDRPELVAIAGALIAKNPGAYHYWSSIGRVHSSQDVVSDLRHGKEGATSVISAREHYIIEITAETLREAIEDLPLEYALTESRFAHLGPNDAIKAALIQVCKQWRLLLRCKSDRDDVDDPSMEYPVYPLGTFDSLVLAALERGEQEMG